MAKQKILNQGFTFKNYESSGPKVKDTHVILAYTESEQGHRVVEGIKIFQTGSSFVKLSLGELRRIDTLISDFVGCPSTDLSQVSEMPGVKLPSIVSSPGKIQDFKEKLRGAFQRESDNMSEKERQAVAGAFNFLDLVFGKSKATK